MQRRGPCRAAAILLLLLGITVTFAGDPHLIEARIANFREIGTAFKAVKDELRSKQPDLAHIRESARFIKTRGAEMPRWFAPGSEPAARTETSWLDTVRGWLGLGAAVALPEQAKTEARMEVWTDPARFKAAHHAFVLEADRLWQAAQTAKMPVIAERFQALGKACESCHKKFKDED